MDIHCIPDQKNKTSSPCLISSACPVYKKRGWIDAGNIKLPIFKLQ
jgi:hypothetical protein